MIPKSRTDKLFGTGSSGLDEDVDAEKDIELMDSTSHDEVSSAAKSRTSSTPSSNSPRSATSSKCRCSRIARA